MKIEETFIKDVLILTPTLHKDTRGYFLESYNKIKLDQIIAVQFVQDNESCSQKGVLRGLHFQKPPYAQGKLIRVISGSVLDVVVDLRKDSLTYGKHFKMILSGTTKQQLYVPVGFAHGFLVLENDTIFNYKCTNYYHKESEVSIDWNDKNLNIDWNIEKPIISEKDKHGLSFTDYKSPF